MSLIASGFRRKTTFLAYFRYYFGISVVAEHCCTDPRIFMLLILPC